MSIKKRMRVGPTAGLMLFQLYLGKPVSTVSQGEELVMASFVEYGMVADGKLTKHGQMIANEICLKMGEICVPRPVK